MCPAALLVVWNQGFMWMKNKTIVCFEDQLKSNLCVCAHACACVCVYNRDVEGSSPRTGSPLGLSRGLLSLHGLR